MWLVPLLGGIAGCAIWALYAASDWPHHALESIVWFPLSALSVWAGAFLWKQHRSSQRMLAQHLASDRRTRASYLRARLLNWGSGLLLPAALVLGIFLSKTDLNRYLVVGVVACGVILSLAGLIYSGRTRAMIEAAIPTPPKDEGV